MYILIWKYIIYNNKCFCLVHIHIPIILDFLLCISWWFSIFFLGLLNSIINVVFVHEHEHKLLRRQLGTMTIWLNKGVVSPLGLKTSSAMGCWLAFQYPAWTPSYRTRFKSNQRSIGYRHKSCAAIDACAQLAWQVGVLDPRVLTWMRTLMPCLLQQPVQHLVALWKLVSLEAGVRGWGDGRDVSRTPVQLLYTLQPRCVVSSTIEHCN